MGYVYQTKEVGSQRNETYCDHCDKTMKKGSSAIVITYHTDDGFRNVRVCSKKCEEAWIDEYENDSDE